jgi:hypothetical protein
VPVPQCTSVLMYSVHTGTSWLPASVERCAGTCCALLPCCCDVCSRYLCNHNHIILIDGSSHSWLWWCYGAALLQELCVVFTTCCYPARGAGHCAWQAPRRRDGLRSRALRLGGACAALVQAPAAPYEGVSGGRMAVVGLPGHSDLKGSRAASTVWG